MHIRDTYRNNLLNLELLARYLSVPVARLRGYYEELRRDAHFMREINRRMQSVRRARGFRKGIFRMRRIPSSDWFAFERVLIYVLIRVLRPRNVLETGVYYGGNSAFALLALARNRRGRLISIDYPDSQIRREKNSSAARHPFVGESELYDADLAPGFIVPDFLRGRWQLILGNSLRVIPRLKQRFDLYLHDSDHSMGFLRRELAAATLRLSPRAALLVDDIDWSNAFYEYCSRNAFYPLLLTDNGKDGLRVRTGVALRRHPWNRIAAVTG